MSGSRILYLQIGIFVLTLIALIASALANS